MIQMKAILSYSLNAKTRKLFSTLTVLLFLHGCYIPWAKEMREGFDPKEEGIIGGCVYFPLGSRVYLPKNSHVLRDYTMYLYDSKKDRKFYLAAPNLTGDYFFKIVPIGEYSLFIANLFLTSFKVESGTFTNLNSFEIVIDTHVLGGRETHGDYLGRYFTAKFHCIKKEDEGTLEYFRINWPKTYNLVMDKVVNIR